MEGGEAGWLAGCVEWVGGMTLGTAWQYIRNHNIMVYDVVQYECMTHHGV